MGIITSRVRHAHKGTGGRSVGWLLSVVFYGCFFRRARCNGQDKVPDARKARGHNRLGKNREGGEGRCPGGFFGGRIRVKPHSEVKFTVVVGFEHQ